MGTVIEISSTMYEPGRGRSALGPDRSWFAVGALDPGGPAGREEEIAALLRHSGTVAIVDDIQCDQVDEARQQRTVLVTTAILGLPMLDAVAGAGHARRSWCAPGRRRSTSGRRSAIRCCRSSGLAAEDVAQPRHGRRDACSTRSTPAFVLPGATTTVLQDWTKGRHSEVDDINGHVVAEGARLGVPTPVNAAVVELAHRIERGELRAGIATSTNCCA